MKYWTKFENETLQEAIQDHAKPYASIEGAESGTQVFGEPGALVEVYDENLVLVHSFTVKEVL